MEDYSKYTKEELQMMWEEIDQPLTSVNHIAVRLCECLSCENCPVVIYKCDHRTEYERTCLHEPCFGELHKWILENINNGNSYENTRKTIK